VSSAAAQRCGARETMELFVAWLVCANSVSSRVGEQDKRRMQKAAGRLLELRGEMRRGDSMLRRLEYVVRALAVDGGMSG
jgi:hypothetical protein